MTDYLISVPVGITVGFFAGFFVQGGFADIKLYLRLSRMKGMWHRQRFIFIVVGVLITVYTTWLLDGFNYKTIGLVILNSFLFTASVTDLRNKKIHVDYVIFYTVCFAVYHLFSENWLQVLINGFIGTVAALTIFGIPKIIKPQMIGTGDLLLLAVCGFGAGLLGMLYLLFRAMIFMLIFSLIQLIRRKVNTKTALPFAPFLFLSCLI